MATVAYALLDSQHKQIPEDLDKFNKKALKLMEDLSQADIVRSFFELGAQKLISVCGCCYLDLLDNAKKHFGVLALFEQYLCFFQDLPPKSALVKTKGWVQKHGKWKSCWIIKDDQMLSFAKDKNPALVIKNVPLGDMHSVLKVENGQRFVLEVLTSFKPYRFAFSDAKERDEWFRELDEYVPGHLACIRFCIPLTYVTECCSLKGAVIFAQGVTISTMKETYTFNWVPETFYSQLEKVVNEVPKALELFGEETGSDAESVASTPNLTKSKVREPSPDDIQTFHKLFQVPETETLLEVHSCSLLRGALTMGHLYLCTHYLCFHSALRKDNIMVRYREISDIEVENWKSHMLPNAIRITIQEEQELIFTFLRYRKSFVSRVKQYMEIDRKSSLRFTRTSMYLEEERKELVPEKSLSIKILLVGSRGDVQPMVAFGLGLKKCSHKVTIATHECHRSLVEGFGLNFFPLYGDPKVLMEISQHSAFSHEFLKLAIKSFPDFVTNVLLTAWEACKHDTDVIIQNPATLGGVHIAEKLGVPLFVAFTFPWTPTTFFPHPYIHSYHKLTSAFNYFTYYAVDEALWAGLYPASGNMMERQNKFRQEVLGLKELPLFSSGMPKYVRDQGIPTLYCWNPLILPKPKDWPSNVYVTGYWFLDFPDYIPPQSLVNFLEQTPKPIYIGFGSVNIPNIKKVLKMLIQALEETNQRAVMMKGWAGLGESVVHERIYVADNIPHDWLFPRLAATVHHGGAGTTSAGLRAGIPNLIIPFFGDQFLWGEQIAKLGVGPTPIPIHDLTVKNFKAAVMQMLTDKVMIEKAINVGQHIRSQDGVARAVSIFHQEVKKAFARSKKTTPTS